MYIVEIYNEKKDQVKPFVFPISVTLLALSSAFLYGKTKGTTYVITTHNSNGETNTEVGRIK